MLRGSILILVMFVMVVLSLVALSFGYRAGLESRLTNQRAVTAQLRSHARSAAAIALARLGENTNEFDHRGEPWHTHRALAGEHWLARWRVGEDQRGAEYVTDYQVIDEQSKVHVAYASGQTLRELGMSAVQAASLMDWMDVDDDVRPDGAEDDFYFARRPGHRCKNGPIEVLDELLMIRGFGGLDYFGEDANDNRRLDVTENDGRPFYPPDNSDGVLQPSWVKLLTCYGDGRVNINTAPRLVLGTLAISDEAVDQIAAYRRYGSATTGALEDHAFRSVSDIEQLQGLTEADRRVLLSVSVFRSTHFRIFVRSVHMPTQSGYTMMVVVEATEAGLRVMQWKSRRD